MYKKLLTMAAGCTLATAAFATSFNAGAVNSSTTPSKNFSRITVNVHIPSLFIGWLNGSVSYAINRSWAVGFRGSYFAINSNNNNNDAGDISGKASSYGLEGTYALSHDLTTDGWLFIPYVSVLNADVVNKPAAGITQKAQTSITMYGTNLAYQWRWESGINMRLGLGVYYTSSKVALGIANSKIHPDLNWTIGYSF